MDVNSIIMDDIWLAAPLIIPQLHIDQVVLTDSQLLQVTAFVPGGDTLISSRSLTMIEKRSRVFTILDTTLRQRFTDMRYVGFLLLTAHPSSKWMDPAFSPQKKKVVVVYSEEGLQGSASVLLRLSLPPHDAEGAIYVRRRLRLRYLIRQLGLSPLCGDDGDECLCYVNGMELSNDREMAWMTRPLYIVGDSLWRTQRRQNWSQLGTRPLNILMMFTCLSAIVHYLPPVLSYGIALRVRDEPEGCCLAETKEIRKIMSGRACAYVHR